MSYPENCIRGIPNQSYISEGLIGAHLFHFNSKHVRGDGWCEQSINWKDNDGVIDFTLLKKKDDEEFQFKAGLAIIPKDELDLLIRRPLISGALSYERQPVENNPYHGNLLLRAHSPKPLMRLIAAGLALSISEHVKNYHNSI